MGMFGMFGSNGASVRKLFVAIGAALVLGLVAAACGGDGGTPTPAPLATATPTATATRVPPTATRVLPTPTPANRPPRADFTFRPEEVARGDNNQTVITFTAIASDPDGDPLTFEWRFSSGTPSTATGQVATTTFPGIRPYTVTLTVSDARGGAVTVEKTVPVTG